MGEEGSTVSQRKWNMPFTVFFKDTSLVWKLDCLGREILGIAFPAALAVAADPIASLIDTAFIGHIGPTELAAAGVSIALFNQASRIFIFPLVSITTSFVAEEDTIEKMNNKANDNYLIEDTSEVKGKMSEKDMLPDLEKGELKSNCETESNEDTEEDTDEEKSSESEAGENYSTMTPMHGSKPNDDGRESKNSYDTEPRKADQVGKRKKRHIASASTALLFGVILGLVQAALLIFAAKPLLVIMGAKHGSPLMLPAQKYLKLRALGAPAVLLSLAMQGIFRGFKDTTTPLYVIVSGYALNVMLDPLLIFVFKMGISGAAIAHVFSQYMMATVLLFILMKKVYLMPPRLKDLQILRFLKNGTLLLARVVAVTFCVTFAAALAARLGPIPMAGFQTCLQVWLTSSLLSDGLAVAVQAILACSFAAKDYDKARAAATRVLQMSFVLGSGLALFVGTGLYFGAGIFSKNASVLHYIRIGLPFVAATQPLNSLAFAFDGVNFGASDFAYAAYSLVMVSIASVATEFILYKHNGFVGIWIGLSVYMGLRTFAGVWRMGTGTGPWRFLRGKL